MALYHHDGRDYQTAATTAATHARDLFQRQIDNGRNSVSTMIEKTLSTVPEDSIIPASAMRFEANGHLKLSVGDDYCRDLHPHAIGQIAARVNVPGQYVTKLLNAPAEQGWKRELLAHTLHEHYSHEEPGTKYLARAVNGQIRGFLSDRFRRLDSRPILDAFIAACTAMHAVPVRGTITDVSCALKVVLPWIFEPVDNEVMLIGLEFSNSDYGAGRVMIRGFIDRLWCTNLATLEDHLSQVHLSSRLPDNILLSEETYRLDTEATVSTVKDVVKDVLGPAKVGTVMQQIVTANEQEVDWRSVSRRLANVLTKAEAEQVKTAYESDDVVMLPAGQTTWRLSNAVSWIANNADVSPERKLELERLAGEVILPKALRESAA